MGGNKRGGGARNQERGRVYFTIISYSLVHPVSRPNMDSYVFIRAVERTEQVNVDPE